MTDPKVIPFLKNIGRLSPEQLHKTLVTSGFSGKIDQINWPSYSYKPDVGFYLAHNDRFLFVYYEVSEKNIKAKYVKDNDAVWEDSCVEAFLTTDINEGYYNFEVNCIGTVLTGFGKGRENRTLLDENQMKSIKRASSFGKEVIGKDNLNGNWWLQLAIPFELIGVKKGQVIQANFYKCGDECKVPHFLSWRPISTPHPDFHQPTFFEELILE